MDEITGFIERITFHNDENGYTVARLQRPSKKNLTCVVGFMPGIQPGETVRLLGEWKNDLAYGWQFAVKEFKTEAPADIIAITKYLGSGLIKGIGPVFAGRIVAVFKENTLQVIDTSPHDLLQVAGLGKKKLNSIIACWKEQKAIREVMLFLQGFGVSPTYAQKIFKAYGQEAISKLEENPYRLARDIRGIGFKTADHIARKMGIEKNSSRRVDAGLEFVLSELSNEGHVCYPLLKYLEAAAQMLEVEKDYCQERVDILRQESRLEIADLEPTGQQEPFIWLKSLYLTELGIAKHLNRLVNASCRLRDIDTEKALAWVQEKLKMELATNQQEAVKQALEEKVQVITGGPGTGKSTITKAILHISSKLTEHILLAAPTGRAAKRMSEICKRKATTIHSLLEFDPKGFGFKRNQDNPLICDLLIVDEASMIDTVLMHSLIKAVPDHARVIFVGDIDQLPSVGPGNVLKDLINSSCVPVTCLKEIFRQARGSRIITNAHRINRGVFPDISNEAKSDLFFISKEESEEVLSCVKDLVAFRLPQKYDLNPIEDIQVLAPMKRGAIGIDNLNLVLQQTLNPHGQGIQRMGTTYKEQDKVMQIRNNYNKEVFNGDVGRITQIDETEQQLVVAFDQNSVVYEFSELDELVLAYAVSVHKYQGSECPCVVMPVHTTHFKMLQRNLLYTGVTRGKKLVVLIGNKKGLALAVHNEEVLLRHTGLAQAIRDKMVAAHFIQ